MIKELNAAIKDMIDAKAVYEDKIEQIKNIVEATVSGYNITLSHINPYFLYINKNETETFHALTVDISDNTCNVVFANIQKMALKELADLEKAISGLLGL